MTSQLHHHHRHHDEAEQASRRDDWLVHGSSDLDLTSLLADDVQSVLKHLGSVRHTVIPSM